jgi:hypothetical protein
VLRGVSGNSKKPYKATGIVMMPSMMNLVKKVRLPQRPTTQT